MSTTTAAAFRTAGTALLVLGGLNLLAAIALIALAQAGAVGVVVLLAGAALAALGVAVRSGSRAATIAAGVLLGVLLGVQVVAFLAGPDVVTVVRVAITAGILFLVVRPLRP